MFGTLLLLALAKTMQVEALPNTITIGKLPYISNFPASKYPSKMRSFFVVLVKTICLRTLFLPAYFP